MRRTLAAVLTLSVLLASTPALADDPAAAKRALQVGATLQNEKAFDLAAEQYEIAYKAQPSAATLKKALDCYKELKQPTKIVDAAKRLLDKHGKELKKPESDALKKLVGEQQANVGKLDVKVTEPGVLVKVDDKDVGTAPLPQPLELDAGTHKVTLSKTGFETLARDVAVKGQDTAVLDAPMEKEITAGKVTVKEKGGQALTVVVDGKEVGTTPWEGELPLGPHTVQLRGKTMAAEAKKIDVVKRQPADVELEATTVAGRLELDVQGGVGVVRVDGNIAGDAKFADALPVGRHVVTVTREGYKKFERTLDVEAGKTIALRVVLEKDVPAAPPPAPNNGGGVIGSLVFTGMFESSDMGNQAQYRCPDIVNSVRCESTNGKGGGVLGSVGYMFGYLGFDFLFGVTADASVARAYTIDPATQGATPGTGNTGYDIVRFGGIAALRFRAAWENDIFRVALAGGPGFAGRFVSVKSDNVQYYSPAGTVDLSVGLRMSKSTAFTLGCMMWFETAGTDATVSRSDSRSPFFGASGAQTFVMPHLGLDFGP